MGKHSETCLYAPPTFCHREVADGARSGDGGAKLTPQLSHNKRANVHFCSEKTGTLTWFGHQEAKKKTGDNENKINTLTYYLVNYY